jgi:hypothetical protein
MTRRCGRVASGVNKLYLDFGSNVNDDDAWRRENRKERIGNVTTVDVSRCTE